MMTIEPVVVTLPTGPRFYRLYRPERQRESGDVCLFLHGTGGTAEWAVEEARVWPRLGQAGIVLIAPDALPPDPTKPPKF
ncbi:MAG: hypothetical protein ACRCZF_12215, partial [Gemmataceae bacterium]